MTSIDAPGTALDQSFTYDTWGLTTAATQGATQIGYTLDPLGRTISRTQGAVTSYAYEASSEDISTETTSGITTSYVSGPGGPLAMKVSGTTSFFIQDLHSDTVGLIGASSTTMSQEYYYSPFGERKPLNAGSSTLGFQSDLTDPVTGTVDMGTRLYMPSLGRFTSRDALFGDPSDPMSMNQWAYAGGNPMTYSDPTGMMQVGGGGGSGCSGGLACTKSYQDALSNGGTCDHCGPTTFGPDPSALRGALQRPAPPPRSGSSNSSRSVRAADLTRRATRSPDRYPRRLDPRIRTGGCVID